MKRRALIEVEWEGEDDRPRVLASQADVQLRAALGDTATVRFISTVGTPSDAA